MRKKSAARPAWLVAAEPAAVSGGPAWTFLTNHAHVLLCIYREPKSRLRDLALRVGITERMVQRIVTDLAEAGYVAVEKHGRRNRYQVRRDMRLRHPLESQCSVTRLLDSLSPGA